MFNKMFKAEHNTFPEHRILIDLYVLTGYWHFDLFYNPVILKTGNMFEIVIGELV